jgi:hypothetical protein
MTHWKMMAFVVWRKMKSSFSRNVPHTANSYFAYRPFAFQGQANIGLVTWAKKRKEKKYHCCKD